MFKCHSDQCPALMGGSLCKENAEEKLSMKGDWLLLNLQRMIGLFMDYCMSKQLRPKTMQSYEQTLKLFARWLKEKMEIEDVEDVSLKEKAGSKSTRLL